MTLNQLSPGSLTSSPSPRRPSDSLSCRTDLNCAVSLFCRDPRSRKTSVSVSNLADLKGSIDAETAVVVKFCPDRVAPFKPRYCNHIVLCSLVFDHVGGLLPRDVGEHRFDGGSQLGREFGRRRRSLHQISACLSFKSKGI